MFRYLCDVEVRINVRQRLAAFFLSKPLSRREKPGQCLAPWGECRPLLSETDLFCHGEE